MDKVRFFVGIDVSKEWLDLAAFLPGSGIVYSDRCVNTEASIGKSFQALYNHLKADSDEFLFCLEHTGIYGHQLLSYAGNCRLKVWQESGWKVKRAQSPRGKSDKMDARRIAEYAYRYRDNVLLWEPESADISRLRDLLALRERLVKGVKMLKAPISEASDVGKEAAVADMARFSDPVVTAMKKQIKEIEREIDRMLAQNPAFKATKDLVTSVPGVGPMTALSLILFTRNFSLFNDPRKLACYCGVAPFEHTSGSSIKGKSRVSNYANKDLKAVIHMAAMSAVRYNKDMKAFYGRKIAEGKNKMSVLNAVRNKLLHCIMAIIKRKTPWAPKFSKAEENFAAAS